MSYANRIFLRSVCKRRNFSRINRIKSMNKLTYSGQRRINSSRIVIQKSNLYAFSMSQHAIETAPGKVVDSQVDRNPTRRPLHTVIKIGFRLN